MPVIVNPEVVELISRHLAAEAMLPLEAGNVRHDLFGGPYDGASYASQTNPAVAELCLPVSVELYDGFAAYAVYLPTSSGTAFKFQRISHMRLNEVPCIADK